MSEQTITQFCECNDPNCRAQIELPTEEVVRARQLGLVLIVIGHSADPTDELVETKAGYYFYRER